MTICGTASRPDGSIACSYLVLLCIRNKDKKNKRKERNVRGKGLLSVRDRRLIIANWRGVDHSLVVVVVVVHADRGDRDHDREQE